MNQRQLEAAALQAHHVRALVPWDRDEVTI